MSRQRNRIFWRARGGDAPAFWFLTEPLQLRLLRQAIALSGEVSSAEDLVSETLVEAWQSLPRYQGRCRFSTWLYSILMHRWHKSAAAPAEPPPRSPQPRSERPAGWRTATAGDEVTSLKCQWA